MQACQEEISSLEQLSRLSASERFLSRCPWGKKRLGVGTAEPIPKGLGQLPAASSAALGVSTQQEGGYDPRQQPPSVPVSRASAPQFGKKVEVGNSKKAPLRNAVELPHSPTCVRLCP